ncbi:MAG TPA: hypothetical protein VH207_01555 [Chthoniobacterales bacterium]|nr:hypothetical protein [Chthoniobacterales bacterium]
MSSANAAKGFGLRCQVCEGLIEFRRSRYPESLPRVRTVLTRLDESRERERPHVAPVEGQEHERGPSAPGLKSDKPA